MIRTVILTFDDAVISQYENVVPLLKELGFNATFFVCRFNDEWRKKNARYLMIGKQLRKLDSAGICASVGQSGFRSFSELYDLSERTRLSCLFPERLFS